MLPTTANGARRSSFKSGSLSTYFRRIIKPKQMDLEYTFWMMLQLCVSPKTAYRHTSYQKQTKNQWARDDPAFVVVTSALVIIAAIAYCATFGHSLWHAAWTVVSALVVDYLLIGFTVATAGWFISNRFLKKKAVHHHQVEQQVEWLYAFDVHCNSYFPLFLTLYVLQFLLSPLLLWKTFVSAALSNLLYAVAFCHYNYLSFLGYSALPFLERTEVFLWPIGAVFMALPFAVLFNFNPTRFTLQLYFG